MNFLFVGLGGALGAMLRYAISMFPFKGEFPFWTFITNILGAVLIGLFTGLAVQKNLSANTLLFLKTGLCGGFTTFSTFSLESYSLFQSHRIGLAVLYMILSCIVCVLGVAAGMMFGQMA